MVYCTCKIRIVNVDCCMCHNITEKNTSFFLQKHNSILDVSFLKNPPDNIIPGVNTHTFLYQHTIY